MTKKGKQNLFTFASYLICKHVKNKSIPKFNYIKSSFLNDNRQSSLCKFLLQRLLFTTCLEKTPLTTVRNIEN